MSDSTEENLAGELAAVDAARAKLVADIDTLDHEVRMEALYRMENIAWKAAAGIAAAIAGIAASKVLGAVWGKVGPGGEPPKDPTDPQTGAKDALLWTALTGVGVGVATVVAQRGAAAGWIKATGKVPPPFKKKLQEPTPKG